MAKCPVCLPICTILIALVCLSIPALADNADLAYAQPDFSMTGLRGITELPPLSFSDKTLFTTAGADGRFISELCSFTCDFQLRRDRLTPTEISWLNHYEGGDYPNFGKSRGEDDSYWRKHTSSVPEPSSLTLLGTAVLGIAFRFRKRFKR